MICCNRSSRKNNNQDSKILVIPRTEQGTNISASKYFSSIDYIFLATHPNSIIADVSDIYIIHDTIVIFDRLLSTIFTFSINGEFIKKIASKIDMTHQINSVNRFNDGIIFNINCDSTVRFIDLNGKSILQMPSSQYKIQFGSVDGKSFWSFFPTANIEFNDNKYFQISDINGKPQGRYVKSSNDSPEYRSALRTITYYYDGCFNLFSAETNTIYKIMRNGVLPTYSFVYEETPMALYDQKDLFEINGIVESADQIFVDVIIKRSLHNFVYHKTDDLIYSIPKIINKLSHVWGINNDIDGIYPVWPTFRVDDKILARVVMAKDIKNFQAQNCNDEGQPRIRNDSILNLIANRKPIENPIIILYHLHNEKENDFD